ncbi:pesticidal protein Cry7Aa [Candidatus Falkowbacteria bacterium]|nr:pesticidal protein Cry7Aa [Candidatus Falkowbacteria bacterium]
MVKVEKIGLILEPTTNVFETRAVLNPAVFQDGNDIHIIYRAIADDYISTLGYARLSGPTNVVERWNKPFMTPKLKAESKGIEDPRIVKIDGTYYMTYVAHDGKNAVTYFAEGPSLFELSRGFMVSPKIMYKEAAEIFRYQKLKDDYYFYEAFYKEFSGKNILIWHKDCILFPEKINGEFKMLQRILPDIQLISFEDFGQLKEKYFWIHYLLSELAASVVLESEYTFEERNVGGGCPPIRTAAGWLMIYHGVHENNSTRTYSACAALLDLEDPRKLIAKLPYPLFTPTNEAESLGLVNNVVFPTGTAQFGDDLYIYYGAADTRIAAAKVSMNELLAELKANPVNTAVQS